MLGDKPAAANRCGMKVAGFKDPDGDLSAYRKQVAAAGGRIHA